MRVLAPGIQFNDPIIDIFKKIAVRFPLRQLSVFEPFIGDVMMMTKNYAQLPWVEHLTGWEINPERARIAKQLIPDADIKVCDTYKELHNLKPHFDVILIDNGLLFTNQPFEHFDLFPTIFKGLKSEGFMVISACDNPGGYYVPREAKTRASLGSRIDEWVMDWDRARADFYRFPQFMPEDYGRLQGRIMPMSEFSANDMVPIYTDLALKVGYFTKYRTVTRRSREMNWILLEVSKFTPRQELEQKTRDKFERIDAESKKTY